MLHFFKNTISKKIILTVFSLAIFCFLNIPRTQAAWIPGLDPAITAGLNMITKLIDGLIVGTLKQQAVMTLSMQVDMLAGRGAGGQATFITNWQTYLVDEPLSKTNIYMNDYISQMTRGRNSSSLYSTEGFSGELNYAAQIGQVAQMLSNAKNATLTYEGNPTQMLQGKNLKAMGNYVKRGNNPVSVSTILETKKNEVYENEKSIALAQGLAYRGYRGTPGDTPGSITFPGSLTGAMMESAKTMPDRILEAASSIPEVATALVSRMISQSITQGFVSIRSKTAKATANITNYTNATNQAINQYGPAARFGVDAVKRAPKAAGDLLL